VKPIWPLTQNVTCRCQPESSSPKLILIHKHFSSGVLHSASFFGSSNQECVISGLWNFHFKPRRRPENGKWIWWVALGFPMHRCQFLASVHSAHLLHYNESWKVNLWALWIRYWAANWIPYIRRLWEKWQILLSLYITHLCAFFCRNRLLIQGHFDLVASWPWLSWPLILALSQFNWKRAQAVCWRYPFDI